MASRSAGRNAGHGTTPALAAALIAEREIHLGGLPGMQPYLPGLDIQPPGQTGAVTCDELHRDQARLVHLVVNQRLSRGIDLAVDASHPTEHVIQRHQREGEGKHADQRRHTTPDRAANPCLPGLRIMLSHASLLLSTAGHAWPAIRISEPVAGRSAASRRCAAARGWVRSTPDHRRIRPRPPPAPSCRHART